MTIKKIKEKMKNYIDFYGDQLPDHSEIDKAKTKKDLYIILKGHLRFLEFQAMDAIIDFYGDQLPDHSEIDKAKTKKDLYIILKGHLRFLEFQAIDAMNDTEQFIKELGLDCF